MDNKAYLDQIAVKGKVKSGPIFTPMLIKIIAAGVVALITLIIVGAVISSSNSNNANTAAPMMRMLLRCFITLIPNPDRGR